MQTHSHRPRPTLWKLFSTWLVLGVQSFGGGSSTFILIHEACMKNGWVGEEEFTRDWALSQVAPGINLLKLTMMLSYQMRGWPGLAAASLGLLLPSASVTAAMTAGFSVIRTNPVVQAAMRGILPATIGLSLSMAVQMGQPILTRAYKEGGLRLAINLLILAGAAGLMASGLVSPVLVLLLAGVAAILLLAVLPSKPALMEHRLEK